MRKFLKIEAPNVKPIVIVSHNGWAGLVAVCDKISNEEETYITEISLWEFIKYVIKKPVKRRKKYKKELIRQHFWYWMMKHCPKLYLWCNKHLKCDTLPF